MHTIERSVLSHTVLLIATIAVASLAGARAAGAEDPFFTLRLPATVEVIVEGDTASGRVPIQLKPGVEIGNLTPTRADVRLGNVSSQSILDAFEVELGTGPRDLGPAFQIEVTLGKELRTGSYTLAVDVTSKTSDKSQSADLVVVVPGATLGQSQSAALPVGVPGVAVSSSLPKLVIRRVERPFKLEWPFEFDDLVQPTSLTLRETGDKSRVRATAYLESILGPDGKPIDTRVELTLPAEIPRGESETVGVALAGSPPPLGRSTGTLSIFAPELATPATLSFEIETRRSYFWIFLWLALGVLAGYLTHTGLEARAERKEAEIQALVLMGRMRDEADKDQNHSIKTKIEALIAGLQAKIDAGDAKQIVDQIPKTDKAFRDLVDGLAKRKAEVEAAFGTLRGLLDTPWQLPSGVAADVDGAIQRLPEVEALLAASDFDGAEARIGDIRTELVGRVIVTADAWRNEAKRPFDRFQVEVPDSVLLGVVEGALDSKPVQPALTALDGLPLDPAQPKKAETAAKLLEAIHKAERTCAERTNSIFRELVLFCDYMLAELKKARPNLPEPGAVDLFEQKFAPLGLTSEEAASWEEAIGRLLAEHAALSASLQAALARQLNEDPDDLDDEAKLRAALKRVKRLRSRKKAPGELDVGGSRPTRRAAAYLAGEREPAPGAREPAHAPRLASHPHVRRARTARELRWIKLGQMVVSMAIISFVGFFLYQPNFAGTWQELAKIFFWGFGLDLGFDKVLALTTQVK